MMRTVGTWCAVAVVAALAYPQPALARSFGQIYTDCGLGAMLSPDTDATAAITNVTWDLGTTAVSSNISSPDSCAGGKQRMVAFIHDSYDNLEKNLASGSGSYLDQLIVLAEYHVQNEQDRQARIEALRDGFTKIASDPGYTGKNRYEKAKALYELVTEQVSQPA